MIDLHTHVLPGIDDGSQSMDMSLDMLSIASDSGVDILVSTPHCNIPGEYDNYADEELARLHELGVTDLYLGIECALEDVLAFVIKGNTLSQAEAAIERLHRAGIDYDAHIMTGICGHGRGEENAAALADFFIEM